MTREQSTAAADPLPAGLFTALDHVGIAVPDLDEAIAFYAEKFGMSVAHEESNDEYHVREAMLEIAGTGVFIQLLAPSSPESPIARFLDRSGPGVQQVAYRVDDIDAACSALQDRGIRIMFPESRRGTAGSRINFLHPKDTGGVFIELVEPADSPTH